MSLSILIPVKSEEDIIEDTLKYFLNSWIKEIEYEIIQFLPSPKQELFNQLESIEKLLSKIISTTKSRM